jgi:hypothetical protein
LLLATAAILLTEINTMNLSFEKKTLYFLAGAVPTERDKEIARALMMKLESAVHFRNGRVDQQGGNPEKADYVFGVEIKDGDGNVTGSSIPGEYANRYRVVNESGEVVSEPFAVAPAAPEATPGNSPNPELAAQIGSVSSGWGAPKP